MDWATIVLDVLTLLIVITSFLAIRDNRKQTEEALAEGQRQSQAALAIAHEQIEQGKEPILIPLSALPLTALAPQLDYAQSDLPLELMNVGTGVALNIWGVLVPPKNIPRTPYAFRNHGHLLQDKKEYGCFPCRTVQLFFYRERQN
jgi:hypothetical protein